MFFLDFGIFFWIHIFLRKFDFYGMFEFDEEICDKYIFIFLDIMGIYLWIFISLYWI